MTLDRLQCPSCGAGINAEGRSALFCSYCGAKLKVKTGASGSPMAVLDAIRGDTLAIRDDTSIVLREAVLARLDNELEPLVERHEALISRQQANARRRSLGWPAAVLLFLGLYIGLPMLLAFCNSAYTGVPVENPELGLLVPLGVILLLGARENIRRNRAKIAEEREQIAAEISALEPKIRDIRGRMASTRAELDALMRDE